MKIAKSIKFTTDQWAKICKYAGTAGEFGGWMERRGGGVVFNFTPQYWAKLLHNAPEDEKRRLVLKHIKDDDQLQGGFIFFE